MVGPPQQWKKRIPGSAPAEAKELAFAGAWPLVTCALHVCANFELYSLEHWFESAAIRLPLLSTLTEAGQTSTLKMLSTSFRVINCWATR